MLMEIQPTLFWTRHVAHCIDLMLEDISKIYLVKEVFKEENTISEFISMP